MQTRTFFDLMRRPARVVALGAGGGRLTAGLLWEIWAILIWTGWLARVGGERIHLARAAGFVGIVWPVGLLSFL